MKEELKNKLALTTFIISLVSVVFSAIECFLPLIILGFLAGITGIVLSIIILNKKIKTTGFISLVLSIVGGIIPIIWLWMYIIS